MGCGVVRQSARPVGPGPPHYELAWLLLVQAADNNRTQQTTWESHKDNLSTVPPHIEGQPSVNYVSSRLNHQEYRREHPRQAV
jgi:hypothetical protein